MIDEKARQKLAQMQNTKALSEGIEKIVGAIRESSVVMPKELVKTPASDVADELRSLQKMIGGGNLTESLLKLSQALDNFNIDDNALGKLKGLVADLSTKLKLLADLEVRIPKDINLNFPEEIQVIGKVNVGKIDELPSVEIKNIADISKGLGIVLNNLQIATIKAIERSKPEFPTSMEVGNEVKVADFSELLEGIEELKKGFNILINKEAATVGFPDRSIPVEIQNWMIPQPVTNVSINPVRGTIFASAVTVTSTVTPLPGTALADRRSVIIYNNSSSTVYIGGSNVTASTGLPIAASSNSPALDAGPRTILYGITASGNADVRVLEMNDLVSGGDN